MDLPALTQAAYNLFRAGSSDLVEAGGGTQLRLSTEGHTPEIRPGLGPAAPAGLTDHFLPLTARFRDFAAGQGRDLTDLATGEFETDLYPMGDRWELLQQRQSGLRAGKRLAPFTLTKKISLGPGGTTWRSTTGLRTAMTARCRCSLPSSGPSPWMLRPTRGMGGKGIMRLTGRANRATPDSGRGATRPNVTALALIDPQPGVAVRLGWDRAALLWVCPYPAATHGEPVRGACVMPVWELRLAPGDNWALGLWALVGPSGPVAPLPPGLAERIARIEWDDEPWKRGSTKLPPASKRERMNW